MDKVLCPWCGEEIEIRVCDAEWNIPFDQDAYKKDPWAGLFYCLYHPSKIDHQCPIATFRYEPLGKSLYDSEEEAYAAAIRRPLQKPMSLKEACESEEPCVYFEQKGVNGIDAVIINEVDVRGIKMHAILEIGVDVDSCEYTIDEKYGKSWRCWATKPTREERETAKWE